MDQFVVPQFIDAEDKILGPLTARQFIIVMFMMLLEFAFFKLLSFTYFLMLGIPVFIIAIIFAFAKINGMPFHYFLLNLIQTIKKPHLRVWYKEHTTSELKAFINVKKPTLPSKPFRKAPMSSSRLQELTLIVDTGGIYKPEEEEK